MKRSNAPMQNPETSSGFEAVGLKPAATEQTPKLDSGAFLSKAAASVDWIAAKGWGRAKVVAKSLGGELDKEVEFDLEAYRRQLTEARHALAVRLGIDVPVLVGHEEGDVHAGEVRESRDVAGAVAYLTGEHPDQEWVQTQVHFLKEQGYENDQVIEAYLLAGKGEELIAERDAFETSRQEFFDEFASVPGGLELFQNHTSAGECVSTSVFAKVLAGPDGVNRGFRFLKFFQDPDNCVLQNRETIEKEQNPDRLAILTALETFSHLIDLTDVDDIVFSALGRGETADEQKGEVREAVERVLLRRIKERRSMNSGIDALKAVGLFDELRASKEFAKKVLADRQMDPSVVLKLVRDFPEIGNLLKANEEYQRHAEGYVVESIKEGSNKDVHEIVECYGITWGSIAKNKIVLHWMEYPSNGSEPRPELTALIEIMKPPREQIMKAVNKALRSAIDSPYGSVDVGGYKAIQEAFGLSEEERASVRLEKIGVAMVKDYLQRHIAAVQTAERVIAASDDPDAVRRRFQSKEIQDIAWPMFENHIRLNKFDAALDLAFFGLDAKKMAGIAAERYLEMIENGEAKTRTDRLDELFDVGLDEIPQSRIDAALRMGIDRCIGQKTIAELAKFVVEHDISPESADVIDRQRAEADLRMKEDLVGYFGLSDPERAKIERLFGVSADSLRFPDASPYVERQARQMIHGNKDALIKLREAVPRIVEQDWYRNEARKRVYQRVNGSMADIGDIRAFVVRVQTLTGLPDMIFRSPEIVASAKDKIRDFFAQGDYQSASQYAEAFGMSAADDVRASLESGHVGSLYFFGTLVNRSDADAWKQGGVRVALEGMARASPGIGEQLTTFYTSRRNFNGLAMAIDLGVASVPYLDESDAVRELQKLVVNGDAIAAEGLLNCYGLGGKLFDAGLRERVKRAAMAERGRRTNREAVSLDKEPHKVERELADFYLDEWIGFELSGLERKASLKNVDLEFSSKMDAYNLKATMREHTESQFKWMREYLVRAVDGEIRHQSQFSQPNESFVSRPANVDDLISKGTKEEIRQYLAASKERFLVPGWNASYGGRPWAQIAETAEMMFSAEPDMRKLVDAVYDLQHNNGTVFNKDADRVFIMATEKINHVLGMKREVSDPEAYLALLEREVEPATFAEISRRWNEWKDVRTKLEREVDGVAPDRRAGLVEAVRERSTDAGVNFAQLMSRLDETGTKGLEDMISSKLLNAGRDGRLYLKNSAEEAIKKRIRAFEGGVVGVVGRLRRKGANRNAEMDVFGPLVSAYLKARGDVLRDQTEVSLAWDIIKYREKKTPVPENHTTDKPISSEIQEIIDAIINP